MSEEERASIAARIAEKRNRCDAAVSAAAPPPQFEQIVRLLSESQELYDQGDLTSAEGVLDQALSLLEGR